MAIGTDDYRTSDSNEVFAGDIEERIETLRRNLREAQQEGEEPDVDEVEECNALVGFRDNVSLTLGKEFAQVAIVPDEDFEDFLKEQAIEIGDVSVDLSSFVEWDAVAERQRASGDWRQFDFGDELVYVR